MIQLDPLEYMRDAFDHCVADMLTATARTPLQTTLRIHVYRKIFTDLARHELASTQITSIDELVSLCGRCFELLGFM
ncbi:MAG: hypothetical protein FD143_3309 [Ignavibacteria bacterium]|nr:MAG: hypothetical protein FD143_3309 [Ignavibacteria bacterium]